MENREIECIKARNIVHHFHNEIISRENYLFDTGKNVGYIFDIQIRFLSYVSNFNFSFLFDTAVGSFCSICYLCTWGWGKVPKLPCSQSREGKNTRGRQLLYFSVKKRLRFSDIARWHSCDIVSLTCGTHVSMEYMVPHVSDTMSRGMSPCNVTESE
jgi:hypothetical protein